MDPINRGLSIAMMNGVSMSGKNDEIALAPLNGLPTSLCSPLASMNVENLTRRNGGGWETSIDNSYKVRT